MARVRIGISGWTYAPWRGPFYPKGLTQKKELAYAAQAFPSLEINGTFYSLQRPSTFTTWHDQTPEDFQFAVKAPQFITHILRLKDCGEPVANFFASGLLCLGQKLGPILWQFPPNVMLKDDRFDIFLEMLPKNSREAAALAKKHGPKVEGRSFFDVKEKFPVRHAFEFRHPSFAAPEFLDKLRKYNVAFVMAHGSKRGPFVEEPTADFIYARLHGEGPKYRKGYPDRELTTWAKNIEAWRKERDVYAYFSNDAKLYSPAGALKLLEQLEKKRKKAA